MRHRTKHHVLIAACAAAAVGMAGLTGCGSTAHDAPVGSDGSTGKKATEKNATGGNTAKGAQENAFEDLPPREIADKALAATRSASSLAVDLDGTVDGQTMRFRLALDRDGDCAGDITTPDGGAELIRTGDKAWFKFDDAFWKSQGGADAQAAADLIGDRWVQTSTDDPDFKDLTSACDLDDLLSSFEGDTTGARKGPPGTVDGKRTVTLVEEDGGETHTASVAAEGTPYLLKIVTEGGKEPGSVTFSDFNEPVKAAAPPAEDVVDLKSLGG